MKMMILIPVVFAVLAGFRVLSQRVRPQGGSPLDPAVLRQNAPWIVSAVLGIALLCALLFRPTRQAPAGTAPQPKAEPPPTVAAPSKEELAPEPELQPREVMPATPVATTAPSVPSSRLEQWIPMPWPRPPRDPTLPRTQGLIWKASLFPSGPKGQAQGRLLLHPTVPGAFFSFQADLLHPDDPETFLCRRRLADGVAVWSQRLSADAVPCVSPEAEHLVVLSHNSSRTITRISAIDARNGVLTDYYHTRYTEHVHYASDRLLLIHPRQKEIQDTRLEFSLARYNQSTQRDALRGTMQRVRIRSPRRLVYPAPIDLLLVGDERSLRVLTASRDRAVRYWKDARTNEPVTVYRGHHYPVQCLGMFERPPAVKTLTPPQTVVVSAAGPEIHLWDLAGTPLYQTTLPTSARVISLSPNFLYALTAEAGKPDIRLWEISSGRELHHFNDPGGEVQQLLFSNDWRHALAVYADGVVAFYGLPVLE
jgi:hypothetical protein